ncbi:MAG: MBOAT family protein [Butyrivibrio sp.]|nr:MBOAT family protein [Butyrivibrio sp.]
MLFNSYFFILMFLPLTIIGYFLISRKSSFAGNLYLLGMSLWFYGFSNPSYLLIIAGSIAVNYFFSKLLCKPEITHRKVFLTVAIFFNIGLIFYFKYYDFFLANMNTLLQTDFVLKNIMLPLGISFFTFQQLSYVIDSYYGKTKDYGFVEYALFVTFFPKLLAGPIASHEELIPQFRDPSKHRLQYENMTRGMMLFTVGLFKKVMVADTFGKGVSWGYSNITGMTSLDTMIIMFAYTFQIYFDFSGYSDMATGLASMMNFTLPMNFDSPYKALSVPDFWRRWHLTLTRFLRTYIYFPLGGSRKGKFRTYVNIMIVFLVSGIWHGANWTFILWGLLHGVANCIGRFIQKPFGKLWKGLQWLITFLFVSFAWLLFRSDSVSQWIYLLQKIFSFDRMNVSEDLARLFRIPHMRYSLELLHIPYTDNGVFMVSMGILFGGVLAISLLCENSYRRKYSCTVKSLIITIVMLMACLVSLSSVSVFLYFNF